MRHLDSDVVAYLRGEPASEERARIDTHLAGCTTCREAVTAFRGIVNELAATRPAPPTVDWSGWQAELRRKLQSRVGPSETPARAPETSRPGGLRPGWHAVPLALSAALAGVLVYVAVHGLGQEPRMAQLIRDAQPADLTLDETIAGGRLDLLRHYSLVETLDLLEDLDVIDNLDRLADVKESRADAITEG